MTEKDIRPVPKYILKKIEREDAHRFPVPEKQVRFYAYLAIWKKELVKVTVAVRHAQRAPPPFAKGPQSPCTGKDTNRRNRNEFQGQESTAPYLLEDLHKQIGGRSI